MKPDFSGRYILNRSASALAGGAAAMESASLNIQHAEPVFRCQARFVAGARTMEYSFELVSDGRAVATSPAEVSSLRWDGDALVVTQDTTDPNRDLRMSWRYELKKGGRRLDAQERIRREGRDDLNLWVFERQ